MTYFNNLGQGRIGWRSPGGGVTPSTLWNSIYAVYNADAVGSSSLKTSLFAAYNGESNANDSKGTNNGTPIGGLTYTTGKIGNAFSFNGSNAYVSLPTNSFNSLTGDFSVSCWFKTNTVSGYPTIFSNQMHNSGNRRGFKINLAMNKVNVWLSNQPTYPELYQDIYTSGFINTDTWYHLSVTRESGIVKIYINGTLSVTDTNSIGTIPYVATTPSIGAYTNGSASPPYYFNGQIDAFNVWNKVLTQSEITELYNAGNGAQYITDSFYKPTTNDALNTNNGTAQGGLTYGVGKVGTAFQFNGTNAYVQLPNNSFNFTGDFSVSGWINQSSTPSYHMIIGNQAGVSGNYYGWLLWVFNNKLTLDLYNGNAGAASARWQPTITLSTNTWIHFAITKKPGQAVKMYLNGVSVPISIIFGSNSGTVTYLTTNYSSIGANKYSSPIVVADAGYWNGSMDALNVWNKELSASEITELYNSGNGKQYPN